MRPSIVTDAAMTPTVAARIVPNQMVATASPPRMPPSQRYSVLKSWLDTPDFSTMMPMKMNSGTARNV